MKNYDKIILTNPKDTSEKNKKENMKNIKSYEEFRKNYRIMKSYALGGLYYVKKKTRFLFLPFWIKQFGDFYSPYEIFSTIEEAEKCIKIAYARYVANRKPDEIVG